MIWVWKQSMHVCLVNGLHWMCVFVPSQNQGCFHLSQNALQSPFPASQLLPPQSPHSPNLHYLLLEETHPLTCSLSHPLCCLQLHPPHRLLPPDDNNNGVLSSDKEGMIAVMIYFLTFVVVTLAACSAISSALLLAMFSSCTKEIPIIVPNTHTVYSHHQD